jgi:hypothetical protein
MLDECTEPTQHRLERSERIGRVPCDFENDPRTTAEGRFGVLLRCCKRVKHVDFYIYHVLTRSSGVGHHIRGQLRVSGRFLGGPFSRDPLSGGIEKTSEMLLPRDPGDVAEWQSRGGGQGTTFLIRFLNCKCRRIVGLCGATAFSFDGTTSGVEPARQGLTLAYESMKQPALEDGHGVLTFRILSATVEPFKPLGH